MRIADLPTPALVADIDAMRFNLGHMAATLPGARCRPHIKAHKSTGLARLQAEASHLSFTCATPLEMIGMAKAGLGDDLLLANEVLDPYRLRELAAVQEQARVTVAVDSEAILDAAGT